MDNIQREIKQEAEDDYNKQVLRNFEKMAHRRLQNPVSDNKSRKDTSGEVNRFASLPQSSLISSNEKHG
jgi:hypothetical protein